VCGVGYYGYYIGCEGNSCQYGCSNGACMTSTTTTSITTTTLPKPKCSDGIDNDGDTKVDLKDPGCKNNPSLDTEIGKCQNGIDDDSDTRTDLLDSGCLNQAYRDSETVACEDKKDNDGDLYIDLQDAGCIGESDTSENPFNPGKTQCSNGIDDDGDSKIDYPNDPGCTSLKDNAEKG